MTRHEAVMERLKKMECPTGKVEKKVLEILVAYKVATPENISVKRDESLDEIGTEAYRADIYGSNPMGLALLCKAGSDDYVARVVDVVKL